MPEPVTTETPRDYLEAAERIPEPSHEELAFALGRLLVWMLDGGKLTRIGQRVIITAYKLRPDTIHGATLAQIARRHRYGRSQAANLARKFTRTFGVKGINDKASALASARYRAAWRRAHPHAKASSQPTQHLWLMNMLTEWHALMDEADAWPVTVGELHRLQREFEPMAKLTRKIENMLDQKLTGARHLSGALAKALECAPEKEGAAMKLRGQIALDREAIRRTLREMKP